MGFSTQDESLTPNRVLIADNRGEVESSDVNTLQLAILEDSQVLNFVKYDSDAGATTNKIYNYSMTDDGGFTVEIGYGRTATTSAIYVKVSDRCFVTSVGIESAGTISTSSDTPTYDNGSTFCRAIRLSGADEWQIMPTLSFKEVACAQLTINSDKGTESWVYTFDVRATLVDADEVMLSVKCVGGRKYSNK